ncbi:MAG TPA: hypothetical protein VJK54_03740 [Chthoniobacterales bacterium]|nr:hypothetical protein [Chthoniobacterales bacterium]
MHCHLMMNPAMVEESEEAIEKFILGETKSALPITRSNYTENQTREQVTANQGFTTKSTLSSQSLLNHTATSSIPTSRFNRQEEEKEFFSSRDDASFTEEALSSSNYSAKTEQPSEENSGIFSKLTGYFSKAVELARTTVDSLYLCPPEAVYDFAASDLDVSQQLELKDEATTTPEEEFSSQELKTSTSTDTTIRQSGSSYFTRAAKAMIGYLACSSILPQAFAARESAFAVYSGHSTDSIYLTSMNANADGSYNIGGYISNSNGLRNGLLGKLSANGQKEWFNEQTSSLYSNIVSESTVIMNGALYAGGSLYTGSEKYPYIISKNNLTDGTLLSAWRLSNELSYGYIKTIFGTASNTLTCFGTDPVVERPFVLEFDPAQGVVTSANTMLDFPGDSYITGAAKMSDHSYVIGGNIWNGSLTGWLSKISYNGNEWDAMWTRFYSGLGHMFINSIAEKDNNIVFSGKIYNSEFSESDGFVGSINGTTGESNWITSIAGEGYNQFSGVAFKKDSSLNDANEIMAVGGTTTGTTTGTGAAWYALMNLNDGTLNKSVILDGSGDDAAQSVVANNDGTFTSIGYTVSYGNSRANLMFVMLDGNGEMDSSILPSAISYSDNSASVVVGAKTITNTVGSYTFSPLSLTADDITSSFSESNYPITTAWQGGTTQPTGQPTGQPTIPTGQPTGHPTSPTGQPTIPTGQPTDQPTIPTGQPTGQPTQPTHQPTGQPTQPTGQPTGQPTDQPSGQPTVQPSQPTGQPTQPTGQPSGQPTVQPTSQPTIPTGQPTGQPTLTPRISAFAIYNASVNNALNTISLSANADNSYNIGTVYGLLGKLNANGQPEWFNKQTSSLYSSIGFRSTVVMDGALYGGGYVSSNGSSYPYISKSSIIDGTTLSGWIFNVTGSISYIFPTANHTLICYGNKYPQGIVFEFDPNQGVVTSANMIAIPYGNSLQAAVAMSDHSYVIGGSRWLSKISYDGTAWVEHWTQIYSYSDLDDGLDMSFRSLAEKNNTAYYTVGGPMDSAIGSVNGTTGQINWFTSLDLIYTGGTMEGIALNNENKIMAVGRSSESDGTSAWYTLMNLNNGTLRKSVHIYGFRKDYAKKVVANNDGTFTSIGGTESYQFGKKLMFVTLDGNGEIDPSILPPDFMYYSDISNSDDADIYVKAETITSSASNLTFSPYSLTAINITSLLSKVDDLTTAVWQQEVTSKPTGQPTGQPTQPTGQPTSQPTGQPTILLGTEPPSSASNSTSKNNDDRLERNPYIIAASSTGAAIVASAVICALRKNLVGYYLKKKLHDYIVPEGDIEQQLEKQVHATTKIPIQGVEEGTSVGSLNQMMKSQLPSSVHNSSNIFHDIESNSLGEDGHVLEERMDVKDHPLDLTIVQNLSQQTIEQAIKRTISSSATQLHDHYKKADEAWEERDRGWKEHSHIYHELQESRKQLTLSEQKLEQATKTTTSEELDKTRLGKISKYAGMAGGIIGYVPEPYTQAAGIGASTLGEIARAINTAWAHGNLALTKKEHQRIKEQHARVQERETQLRQQILPLEQRAQQIETLSSAQVEQTTKTLAQQLHPQTDWQESQYQSWGTLVGPTWDEQEKCHLIDQARLNPSWVEETTKKSWEQKIETSKEQYAALQKKANLASLKRQYDSACQQYERAQIQEEQQQRLLGQSQNSIEDLKHEIEKRVDELEKLEAKDKVQFERKKKEFIEKLQELEKTQQHLQGLQKKWEETVQRTSTQEEQRYTASKAYQTAKEEEERTLTRVKKAYQTDRELLQKIWLKSATSNYKDWSLPEIATAQTTANALESVEKTIRDKECEPPIQRLEELENQGRNLRLREAMMITSTSPGTGKTGTVQNLFSRQPSSSHSSHEYSVDQVQEWVLQKQKQPSTQDQERWGIREKLDQLQQEISAKRKELKDNPFIGGQIFDSNEMEGNDDDDGKSKLSTVTEQTVSSRTSASSSVLSVSKISAFSFGGGTLFGNKKTRVTPWLEPINENPQDLQEKIKQLQEQASNLKKRYFELLDQAETERLSSQGQKSIPFSKETDRNYAWEGADRKSVVLIQEKRREQEREKIAQGERESWQTNTERWRIRAQADYADRAFKQAQERTITLGEEARKARTIAELTEVDKKKKEALVEEEKLKQAWFAAEEEWEKIAQEYRDERLEQSIAEGKKSNEQLKERDRAVNRRWEKLLKKYQNPEFEKSAVEQEEISEAIMALEGQLEQAYTESLITCGNQEEVLAHYKEVVFKRALENARKHPEEMAAIWEQIATKKTATKQTSTIKEKNIEAQQEINKQATAVFKEEVRRLERIEKIWEGILQGEQEEAQQRREQAAQAYYRGNYSDWNSLSEQERTCYNSQVSKANEEYDQKRDGASEMIADAQAEKIRIEDERKRIEEKSWFSISAAKQKAELIRFDQQLEKLEDTIKKTSRQLNEQEDFLRIGKKASQKENYDEGK